MITHATSCNSYGTLSSQYASFCHFTDNKIEAKRVQVTWPKSYKASSNPSTSGCDTHVSTAIQRSERFCDMLKDTPKVDRCSLFGERFMQWYQDVNHKQKVLDRVE